MNPTSGDIYRKGEFYICVLFVLHGIVYWRLYNRVTVNASRLKDWKRGMRRAVQVTASEAHEACYSDC